MEEKQQDTMDRAIASAMDAIENSLKNCHDDLVQAMGLADEDEVPKVKVSISLAMEQTGADEISCKSKVSFTKEKKTVEYEWKVNNQPALPFAG